MPATGTFETWDWPPCCGLCQATRGLHGHHKVYRSRGGSDREENIVLLCVVCHAAVHGIAAVLNGHRCASCRVLRRDGCHFGEIVTGREPATPPPWDSREEGT